MSDDIDALKAMTMWANPMLPPVFPAQIYSIEEQFPREHPNLNGDESRIECLIESLPPWQQELLRKEFGATDHKMLAPPRRYGRARGLELMALLIDEIEHANRDVTDATEGATKALKALPRPSTTPPMWAHDPTRSRRPKRKKNQPNRQGIA